MVGLTTGLLLLVRADRRTQAQKRALFADQAATERDARYDQRALPYLLQLRREGEDSAALHLAIADASRDLQRATGVVVSAPKGTIAAEWSPEGSWFVVMERGGRIQVVAADGTIKQVWDAERELNRPTIREDGTIAATDFDGVLWLWNLGVAQATSFPPHVAGRGAPAGVPYRTAAFEPGGAQIGALGPDGVTRIWDAAGQVTQLGQAGSPGTDLVATRDLLVACRADGHVQGWRWSDHVRVLDLPPEATGYCSLAVTPRGDVLAVTGNRLTVWGAGPFGSTARTSLREQADDVSRRCASRADRAVRHDRSRRGARGRLASHGRERRSVEQHRAVERGVVAGRTPSDDFRHRWLLPDLGSRESRGADHAGCESLWRHVFSCAAGSTLEPVSRDGRTLLTRSGVDARLWRIDDAWPVLEHPPCACKGNYAARWSRDETAIVATGRGFAVILDGGRLLKVDPAPSRGWDAAWSADGARALIVGDDGYAKVFARDGSLIHDLPGHSGSVNHAATSPDGRSFATACSDRLVRLFDVATGSLTSSFDLGAPAMSVAWSPDGQRVAAAGYDGSISIWEVATKKLEQRLFDPSTQFLDLSFDPTGTLVATAGQDSVVRVWTLSEGTYRELLGHQGPVTGVAWSPDGGLLATAAERYGIRIWDPRSGREIARRDLGTSFMGVEWSRDGSRLLAAGGDRGVLVLDARHVRQPIEDLERLVESGPWELEDGQLIRKQR